MKGRRAGAPSDALEDVDVGIRGQAAIHFATLSNRATLTAGDFDVI